LGHPVLTIGLRNRFNVYTVQVQKTNLKLSLLCEIFQLFRSLVYFYFTVYRCMKLFETKINEQASEKVKNFRRLVNVALQLFKEKKNKKNKNIK